MLIHHNLTKPTEQNVLTEHRQLLKNAYFLSRLQSQNTLNRPDTLKICFYLCPQWGVYGIHRRTIYHRYQSERKESISRIIPEILPSTGTLCPEIPRGQRPGRGLCPGTICIGMGTERNVPFLRTLAEFPLPFPPKRLSGPLETPDRRKKNTPIITKPTQPEPSAIMKK